MKSLLYEPCFICGVEWVEGTLSLCIYNDGSNTTASSYWCWRTCPSCRQSNKQQELHSELSQ